MFMKKNKKVVEKEYRREYEKYPQKESGQFK